MWYNRHQPAHYNAEPRGVWPHGGWTRPGVTRLQWGLSWLVCCFDDVSSPGLVSKRAQVRMMSEIGFSHTFPIFGWQLIDPCAAAWTLLTQLPISLFPPCNRKTTSFQLFGDGPLRHRDPFPVENENVCNRTSTKWKYCHHPIQLVLGIALGSLKPLI